MSATFEWIAGKDVSNELAEECRQLFSNHYGRWSLTAPHRAGARIAVPIQLFASLMRSDDARLAIARVDGTLVAYAAAIQPLVAGRGRFSWVTQLVVHVDYRRQGLAKKLLMSIWGFSDHFGWGLVTANPFTVRALEKATRRRVVAQRVSAGISDLLQAAKHVPYLKEGVELVCNESESRINTNFFVDHSDVDEMVQMASVSAPWQLGSLPEGWEWLAFTFNDQTQLVLPDADTQDTYQMSDETTAQAYSRMTMDDKHPWMRHASHEAEFIAKHCAITDQSRVLDLGCGNGRHLLLLGGKIAAGVGVDFIAARVRAANDDAARHKRPLTFCSADARDVQVGELFDCVLCLYDVVGSYANEEENLRIVRNIARHLRAGGNALISVMNLELTAKIATQTFSAEREPDRLLKLAPSGTMEKTGNIFDPRYFLLDTDRGVVYRKEQFDVGSALPQELVVRDQRFTADQIEDLCRRGGLEVIWSRGVALGKWDVPLAATDSAAKEILVLCRRS